MELKEKVSEFFKDEYDVEFNSLLPSPENIASLLHSSSYCEGNAIREIYSIIKNLNNEIVYNKWNDGKKKDLTKVFAKNFLSKKLHDLSGMLKENTALKNHRGLAISEYDAGHELVEQQKPFALNFLNKAKENYQWCNKEGNDAHALYGLAGTKLEIALALYNESKLNNTAIPLNEILDNANIAYYLINKSIENVSSLSDIIKFQIFFAKRFFNFTAYIKNVLRESCREDYFLLCDSSRKLYKKLGLEYLIPMKDQSVAE